MSALIAVKDDFMNTLDDRVEDIINNEMDGKPPRNAPKIGSWVITCPRELSVEATGSDLPIIKAPAKFSGIWYTCREHGSGESGEQKSAGTVSVPALSRFACIPVRTSL